MGYFFDNKSTLQFLFDSDNVKASARGVFGPKMHKMRKMTFFAYNSVTVGRREDFRASPMPYLFIRIPNIPVQSLYNHF